MRKKIELLICTHLIFNFRIFTFCFISTNSVAQINENLDGIFFTENINQWPTNVFAQAKIPDGSLFIEKNKLKYVFYKIEKDDHNHFVQNDNLNAHSYTIDFVGSNDFVTLSKKNKLDFCYNYFLGNKNTWSSKVNNYKELYLNDLYKGIDCQILGYENTIKYNFILSENSDPDNIKLDFKECDLKIDPFGNLSIKTSVNHLIEKKPVAFQIIEEDTFFVACEYVLKSNQITFKLGQYEKKYPLIIDPEIIFSSYSGSTSDNWGNTATYDLIGNTIGGGTSFGSGYPTTVGAFQTTFSAQTDVAISKFNVNGDQLLFATYIGGADREAPQSLVTNDNGDIFIYGVTGSSNFPTTNAFDSTFNGGVSMIHTLGFFFPNGVDIFVSRISSDGSSLIGSTFVGGSGADGINDGNNAHGLSPNYGDDFRGEIILNENNEVVVVSSTVSSDFPISIGAFQPSISGPQDACVFSLNQNLSILLWSTYFGGSGYESGLSISNLNDKYYFTGGTTSNNLPGVNSTVLNPNFLGGITDGYAVKLNHNGTLVENATYIGTSEKDQSYFIELDDSSNVYLYGITHGDYPVTPGTFNSNAGQFIHKLTPSLSSTIYSGTFGYTSTSGISSHNISPSAFSVTKCGDILISGWAASMSLGTSTTNLPVTSDAFQSTTDGSDFYFAKFSNQFSTLSYATFFGGISGEHVDGGTSRFDDRGRIYQAVCAGCGGNSSFPSTPSASFTQNGSTNCNLAVVKFEIDKVKSSFLTNGQNDTLKICQGDTVFITNTSQGGDEYLYDFGNGTTATEFSPNIIYTNPGTYKITLIVKNDCLYPDTSYRFVKVITKSTSNFDFEILDDKCSDSIRVKFDNLSQNAINQTIDFGFGDITEFNNQSITHVFNNTGNYKITVYSFSDTTVCPIDSLSKTINIEIINNTIPKFIIPNVITANRDNINDYFELNLKEDEKSSIIDFRLTFLNRWGNIVFETNDLNYNWFPSKNDVVEGIYFLKIEYVTNCSNERFVEQAFVHIFQ